MKKNYIFFNFGGFQGPPKPPKMQNMGFVGPRTLRTPPKKSLILHFYPAIVQLFSKTHYFLVGHNHIPVKIGSSAPSKVIFVFFGTP